MHGKILTSPFYNFKILIIFILSVKNPNIINIHSFIFENIDLKCYQHNLAQEKYKLYRCLRFRIN